MRTIVINVENEIKEAIKAAGINLEEKDGVTRIWRNSNSKELLKFTDIKTKEEEFYEIRIQQTGINEAGVWLNKLSEKEYWRMKTE